jgi:hypothetical protein
MHQKGAAYIYLSKTMTLFSDLRDMPLVYFCLEKEIILLLSRELSKAIIAGYVMH